MTSCPLSKAKGKVKFHSPVLVNFKQGIVAHFCQNTSCELSAENRFFFECDGSCTRRSTPKNNGYFLDLRQLTRHLSNFHTVQDVLDDDDQFDFTTDDPSVCTLLTDNPAPDQAEPSLYDDDSLDDFSVGDPITFDIQAMEMAPACDTPRIPFVSTSLEAYHNFAVLCNHGHAAAACNLICRSAFQSDTLRANDVLNGLVPKDFTALFLKVALLVSSHGEKENILFSEILRTLFCLVGEMEQKLYPGNHELLRKLVYMYHIPVTMDDFGKRLEGRSNSRSFHCLLPIPAVSHDCDTEHGMCTPTEVIPLAMFLPPVDTKEHDNPRYRSLVESESFFQKRMLVPEEYRSPTRTDRTPSVLVYTVIWSDGWDPNRSNKGNRYPVWTATATMVFVELGTTDKPYLVVTELLATGPGKDSHNGFYEMLRNEKRKVWENEDGTLQPLRFYSKHHGCDVNVFVSLGLFLQDNPERRSAAELKGGNSNNHGIFGVSCNFDLLEVPFQSCRACRELLLPYIKAKNFDDDPTNVCCKGCMGWSIDKLCSVGKYKEPISENLKLEEGEHGFHLTLGPGRITFDMCKKAWAHAIEKFIEKPEWTAGNTEAYFDLFCFNKSLINRFIEEARAYINIKEARNPGSVVFTSEDERQYWFDQERFELPNYPAMWDLVEIEEITETPMHLGMGGQKAVLRSTLLYCSSRGKKVEFVRRSRKVIKNLILVRVDIAPVLLYKDEKFGGYVAENYSAITMVNVWLSRILQEKSMRPGPPAAVPDPAIKPIARWTGVECKAWLKERGQPYSTYAAHEAREIVSDFLKGPQSQVPPIIPNLARDLDPKYVRSLLQNANALFGSIMATDLVGTKAKHRSQAILALFLSNYDLLDERLMPQRKKPVWIAKYNMLGLLRVPEHFVHYGQFRNLYEGGDIGEGIVKQLRKLCPQGVREGWSRSMMNNFYRQRAMKTLQEGSAGMGLETVLGGLGGGSLDTDTSLSAHQKRKFRRYKDYTEVSQFLRNARPMSVVVCQHLQELTFCFGVVIKECTGTWKIHQIQEDWENGWRDNQGYKYFSIVLDAKGHSISSKFMPTLPQCQFHTFGLMLPDHWSAKLPTDQYYKYAFVGEDWEHLKASDTWTRLV